jgi:MFS family permease
MWSEIFRGERAAYTVVLTLGVGLHAIDVFVISSILPTVVGDIGGEAYYAWSTMLYMVASILGTAGGGILKAAIGARRGYALGGLIFLAGTALCGLSPSMPVLLAAGWSRAWWRAASQPVAAGQRALLQSCTASWR